MVKKRQLFWMVCVSLLVIAGVSTFILQRNRHQGHQHQSVSEYYTCAMHPQIIKDKPGNCPICSMRLIKKIRRMQDGSSSNDIKTIIRGVHLSPNQRMLANVATVEVEKQKLTRTIRTVAILAFDRDLFVASQEYLSALKMSRGATTGADDIKRQVAGLVKAASDKLLLLGLSLEEIQHLNQTGKLDRSLYLAEKGSDLWLNATIYESERQWVEPGDKVEILIDAVSKESLQGSIVSILPVVDPTTRSFTARIRVENPQNQTIGSSMYATAKIRRGLGEHLAVPRSSVIDTGDRRVVWVELAKNQFEPREVRLGGQADDYFIVLSGLKAGDKVVHQGGFLLDSEAQLKSAGNVMNNMDHSREDLTPVDHGH